MCFVTPLRRISSKRGWIHGGSNACSAIGAPDDEPILACDPAYPPCDAEPLDSLPGDPVASRPVLEVADVVRQYGRRISRALARLSLPSSGVSCGPLRPAGRPPWEAT